MMILPADVEHMLSDMVSPDVDIISLTVHNIGKTVSPWKSHVGSFRTCSSASRSSTEMPFVAGLVGVTEFSVVSAYTPNGERRMERRKMSFPQSVQMIGPSIVGPPASQPAMLLSSD